MAFGRTIRHGFLNYDDNIYIYQNLTVLAGLTRRGFLWAFTFAEIGHWHPLTWVSHMLDCSLFGLRAGGHHLTNVVLHGTAVILLFLALKEMTGAFWRSAFVAVLFAIHPQRVESVAWIAERKDVLSGVFFMATLLAYLRYLRRPPSLARYALVLILFALGLMSKGMLVTLPFVLLLLDYWPLGRVTPEVLRGIRLSENRTIVWRLVWEKVPLFVLSVGSCIATRLSPEVIAPGLQMTLPARIENAVVSYFIYLKQMFWPVDLTLPYFNPPGGFPLSQVIGALVILLGVSAFAIWSWRTRPYLTVGWLWYVGMMAPVIGLVQISYYARADRYTYLPQIGVYLWLIWGAAEWVRGWRYRREISAVAAFLLIAVLLRQTQAQTSFWRDSETLWQHALRTAPDNYVAHTNMGLVLQEKGDPVAAIAQYETALRIQPAYAETHNNFGNALCETGRVREAIVQYQEALALVPDLSQVHNNLGTAFGQNGQTAEAIAQFEKALEISPKFAAAHGNLGYALLLAGRVDEAQHHLLKALELRPGSAEIHKRVAETFLKQRRPADAVAHYRKALEIKPDDAEARLGLASALAEQGQ